jgi:ABC-type multidrug transport system ATPase subunit
MSSHLLHEVEQLADVVGIIDRGKLIREGALDKLLDDAGRVRVRVDPGQMSQAAAILRDIAPGRPLYGEDAGDRAGWFTVNVSPDRAADINRALSAAGIYASGLEPGSDLESIFLEITGTGAVIHERPDEGMPPPGPQGPMPPPGPQGPLPGPQGPAQ